MSQVSMHEVTVRGGQLPVRAPPTSLGVLLDVSTGKRLMILTADPYS